MVEGMGSDHVGKLDIEEHSTTLCCIFVSHKLRDSFHRGLGLGSLCEERVDDPTLAVTCTRPVSVHKNLSAGKISIIYNIPLSSNDADMTAWKENTSRRNYEIMVH